MKTFRLGLACTLALVFSGTASAETLTVQRVVDGDTLVLSTGERVRLIGVDTPETKHSKKPVEYFGLEAAAFTKKQIEGQEVRLDYEWEKKDSYDRTLAYVYRKSDNFFLNAEIIKQGYGYPYGRYAFKYLEDFRRYGKEARATGAGLWASVPSKKKKELAN